MKHHDQTASWEKRICLTYTSASVESQEVSEGSQELKMAGSWRQELMQRPWRGAANCLASYGLLSLLSYRTQDHQPRDGTTHNRLGLPTSITN